MKTLLALGAAAVFALGASSAQAAYTTVNLDSYVNSTGLINNGTFPTGTSTGNQGLEVPFLVSGSNGFAEIWLAPGANYTLTVPLSLSGQTTFYALLNNYFGKPGVLEYTITINTLNSGAFVYDAIGGVDTRDYNQNVFTNDLAPTTTPWFDNGIGQRFDMRQFTLPGVAADDTVTSFVITQIDGQDRAILAGLTFSTTAGVLDVVPEASTWMMMITGFGLVGAAIRRRHRTALGFA